MVKIIDYKQRVNSDGEEFFVLILSGGLELVRSRETERIYATSRTTSMSSTFNEEMCKSMIGQEIPGTIQKVEVEPYEYVIQDTGEVISLSHKWEYTPEGETAPAETKVAEKEPQTLVDLINS